MPNFVDGNFVFGALVALATFATILSLAMPLLDREPLERRMRSVASEREKIRARERDKLQSSKGSLRPEAKAYMKRIVDRFNLNLWLGTAQAKEQMARAGFRGSAAETGFLFFRLVVPIGTLVLGAFYVFVIADFDWPLTIKFGMILFAAYAGLKAPEIYISNTISKRQQSMTRNFPDAMDLLLICVESGMSIEQAFRKVSQEIGVQSIALAEELALTTAELSFLPERRQAYENFANRTGVDSIKQIVTVLIQAEKYGTPLGTALRVLGQESREHRLLLAEQKAAALPPKLTVPMIIFFLPVLFAVIITPAAIQVSHQM
jgi:tight adherence protein C